MRRFYINPDTSVASPVITGSDAKHIKNVLRLKPGDKVLLFDGTGHEYESEITTFSKNTVFLNILRKFSTTTESPVSITVAQAFLKDKKMDTIIRQLTELGITKWFPFISQRSVPRPDKKRLSTRKIRWEKIAKESLKQCKRGCLPEIGELISYEKAINPAEKYDLKVVFWENELKSIDASLISSETRIKKILVMIGPEGGFSTDEIEKAKASGFISATLGPRILKADTAPIVAITLIQYIFGDIGNKSLDKAHPIY